MIRRDDASACLQMLQGVNARVAGVTAMNALDSRGEPRLHHTAFGPSSFAPAPAVAPARASSVVKPAPKAGSTSTAVVVDMLRGLVVSTLRSWRLSTPWSWSPTSSPPATIARC
jgi:hypothetical protein